MEDIRYSTDTERSLNESTTPCVLDLWMDCVSSLY